MKTYPKSAVWNKLVRDGIPEYLENTVGVQAITKYISKEETIDQLKEKLIEEVREIEEAENNEEIRDEMADILEVYYALLDEYGFELDEIEQIRNKKCEKRGAFKDRIFLIETREGK